MIDNLKSHKLLFKDGTSQQDRKIDAIEPDYIQVEGRSIEDLIAEAQRLAKELRFFDDNNEAKSGQTWESFLIDDAVAYNKEGENGKKKKLLREQWASQLAAYVEDPECFVNDQEKIVKLSKPHVVLFMTFLKLLNHVKSQINGLTQKHLDFYFREHLGLTPKEEVPDVVNVLLELAENIEHLEVKKGTILQAGEDESGNELHYKTDEDTIISQAKITQLKNVFIEKQFLTIRGAHLNNADTEDLGLTSMMEMALGHPNPGDPLPDLPEGVNDLLALNILIQQGDLEVLPYVTEQLFLSVQDFSLILQKNQEEKEGIPTDWQEVYNTLDLAHKNKIKHKREQELKELNEKEGFESMVKQVYGNPLPGDDLPLYQGDQASFDTIFDDLKSPGINANKALEYIDQDLKLGQEDFIHIIQTSKSPAALEEDINKIYSILELADRQIRTFSLPSPGIEKLSDIYVTPDARAHAFSDSGDEQESKRFKTFGNRSQAGSNHLSPPSTIGFAMSSPTLLLKEGQRKIEVLLDLGLEGSDTDALKSVFNKNDPFQIYLSSNGQWFKPGKISFALGNYLGLVSEGTYSIEVAGEAITATGEGDFNIKDIGKYIVSDTKNIYEILEITSPQKVKVREVGDLDGNLEEPQKYAANQVYLNALKVEIELLEDDLPVTPFGSDASSSFIESDQPSMVFMLNHFLEGPIGRETYKSDYQKLINLGLHKAHLRVDVRGIKNITLQNDQNIIDAKKPFEPFGFEPETGDSFYLANEEICRKRLNHLKLDMQWVKLPESFKEYYKNYWLIDADDPALSTDAYTIKNNSDFKAEVFFHDKNAEVLLSNLVEDSEGEEVTEGVALFPNEGKINIADLPSRMQQTTPKYQYKTDADAIVDKEGVLEWDRYFRLELDPLDFQHTLYNTLFSRQAFSEKPAIKTLKITPPYQPKLKKLNIDYSAYADILPEQTSTKSIDELFHIHPFGFRPVDVATNPRLLPKYDNEGMLYLGIDQLKLPQIVSILFQMAEGSANPDVEKPALQWSYLQDNEWIDVKASDILLDTTNGLINTGIVKIKIPTDATTGGTLMPNALHWLKISAASNITGVSDTIDIRSQVISATLSNAIVDPLHFENPLAANTITESLNPIAEIDAINQPYTSSKGKPAEQGSALYKRLSERLRHKNRALTMWDYEHIVLNEFPQVYKAKCFPSGDQPGRVDVIVVPDIKGQLPFNPFAPKVAADTLFQIREYLDYHTPAHAEVAVMNPFYLQVLTRCTVKFHPEYDETFHKEKLIEEIKRFLSPWAYDQDSDIRIGGSLHASVLINFIAERPYIDYVANLKLFQSEDGKTFTDVRSINNGKSIVVPSRPDMVMVSGATHFIDIVDENGYDEDSFEGINYMQIQLDFEVAKDLKSTTLEQAQEG